MLAKVSVSQGSTDSLKDGSDTILFLTLPSTSPSNAQVIGLDAVVIASSDVNPVGAITLDQMRSVLNGSITNWKDLGSGDSAIPVHVADGDAGFQAKVKALGLEPTASAFVTQHARMKDLAYAVENDPFGVTVVPFSGLRTARAMELRGACGMHNEAKIFKVQSGSYSLNFALSVSKPNKRLPIFAWKFLEFLETEQAQAVIADLGFGDLGIRTRELDSQGQRLANSVMIIGKEVREMMTIMSGAQLLSLTFRFEAGSTRLDGPSKENAEALVAGMILGNYADKVVYLMGFSDGDGRARQNKALPKDRAEAVRAELIKAVPEGVLAQRA